MFVVRKLNIIAFATFVAVAAFPAGALAHVCTADAFRYCSSVIPNREKIAQCLHERRQILQPACAALFEDSTASVDPRRPSPVNDPRALPDDRRAPTRPDVRYEIRR